MCNVYITNSCWEVRDGLMDPSSLQVLSSPGLSFCGQIKKRLDERFTSKCYQFVPNSPWLKTPPRRLLFPSGKHHQAS